MRPVFNKNRDMATKLLKITKVKFHENPSCGRHHVTGRQTDLPEASTSFFSPAQEILGL
jgi:hypothetical protein